jgi:hypothetical protein
VVLAGNSRTVIETLCPLRAGNSVKAALKTLKAVGRPPPTRERMPVNVKKFPSAVTFEGIIKSERMSGSPAIAIFMIANDEISNEKNLMAKVLEAMQKKLSIDMGKAVNYGILVIVDVVE